VVEIDLPFHGQLRTLIFKRFNLRAWTDSLAALVRPTPALRSWIHGHGFRERGLPTAQPLLLLHRTRLGLLRQGYLLTEKIHDGCELTEFVRGLRRLDADTRRTVLRRRIEAVSRVIHMLHDRQLSHRDLKASNILVRRDDVPTPPPSVDDPSIHSLLHMPERDVWLIDLVGVEAFRRLPTRRKIQNLARLNVSFINSPDISRADRARFLRCYLLACAGHLGHWKKWWRRIAAASARKVRRNQRRGRPLG
jgi:hypothetical protein